MKVTIFTYPQLIVTIFTYLQKSLQNLEEAGDELMLADDDEPAVYPPL